MFMQSNGGLTDASLFQGKDSILSGPAGGIVGAAKTCEYEDVGRSSASIWAAHPQTLRTTRTSSSSVLSRQRWLGFVCSASLAMKIHTVAAGRAHWRAFDGQRLTCGGRECRSGADRLVIGVAGPLTVTDCNVMLGKINPKYFPRVFGPNAEPLDTDAVREKFEAMALKKSTRRRARTRLRSRSPTASCRSQLTTWPTPSKTSACAATTCPSTPCAVSAGAQHACLVADALGISPVFIHQLGGVLSAYGMGLADIRAMREETVEMTMGAEGTAQRGGCSRRARDQVSPRSSTSKASATRAVRFGGLCAHEVPKHGFVTVGRLLQKTRLN